jgi:methionyl-tRNA formyltransferase
MALRVAFFGTPGFAVPSLERLLASSHTIAGVVTQPDRPRGRGQRVTPSPIKALAASAGLTVLQPARLSPEAFEAEFRALDADLGVVAAYGKILPDWLLGAPRLGLINVHASLLPRYRGASPIHHAVMAGDPVTGATIMRIVKELDSGPILAQAEVPIGPDDTAVDIERLVASRGAELLLEIVDRLAAGAVPETAQDEARATYAPKLTKADGVIDWSRSADQIHNQIRGLTPWPHAYTFLDDVRYILHGSHVGALPPEGAPPGTIVAASGHEGLLVACGDGGVLDVLALQLEGKRVMSAREFLATQMLRAGSRFAKA